MMVTPGMLHLQVILTDHVYLPMGNDNAPNR